MRIALTLTVLLVARTVHAGPFEESLGRIRNIAQDAVAAAQAWPGPLRSRRSTPEQKLAALELIEAQGRFTPEAAVDVLEFVENEKDPVLRERGARTFYLLFYDTRDARTEAFDFFFRLGMPSRFSGLSRDPEPGVRRYLLQTCQIMVEGFDPGRRDEVARRYLGVPLSRLDDPVVDLRHEALAALENWADTPVMKTGMTRWLLVRRMEAQTDSGVRERIADLLGERK